MPRRVATMLFVACVGICDSRTDHASGSRDVLPRIHELRGGAQKLPRIHELRGGARIGPLRVGPLSLSLSPTTAVWFNAFAGMMYSISLIGLDPGLPDPTLKYWQQEQTPATRAILEFFALALTWINLFMIYALVHLKATATGLLRFQTFGWASTLALIGWQVNAYGFRAQQDTLGVQITLCAISAYLGFAPW